MQLWIECATDALKWFFPVNQHTAIFVFLLSRTKYLIVSRYGSVQISRFMKASERPVSTFKFPLNFFVTWYYFDFSSKFDSLCRWKPNVLHRTVSVFRVLCRKANTVVHNWGKHFHYWRCCNVTQSTIVWALQYERLRASLWHTGTILTTPLEIIDKSSGLLVVEHQRSKCRKWLYCIEKISKFVKIADRSFAGLFVWNYTLRFGTSYLEKNLSISGRFLTVWWRIAERRTCFARKKSDRQICLPLSDRGICRQFFGDRRVFHGCGSESHQNVD